MEQFSRDAVKKLFKERGLQPLKRLGQNFLIDEDAIGKIIAAADLNPEDTVLEIGPGLGVLTQKLAKKAKKVIAVEKDPKMVEILKETIGDFKNIDIVQEDILRFDLAKLRLMFGGRTSFKIVGNLPFYLTAPVIRMFLEMIEVGPQSMTLVVQKEVGQRICAKPPRMSILANAVQFYADPEMISVISKKSFFPQPKVDAALIKITPRVAPAGDSKIFFEVVKAGFSHPRKQILNNLSKKLKLSKEETKSWLLKNGVQPSQRAETLTIEDWKGLTQSFKFNEN